MRLGFARVVSALAAFVFTSAAAFGAAFTPGNLVVYRVGTGAAALNATATPVFLDEYTPAGVLVQSIAMPTADAGSNQMLTASGSATSEGLMTRSTDGRYLVLPGYDAAVGTAAVAGTSSATIKRVIGRVDVSGNVDTTTNTADFTATNPRGAASLDGTGFWTTGGTGGVRYVTLGGTSSTQVSGTTTNLRNINVFGGQLYVSSASGSLRVGTVGTGTPTTTGQTTANLPGFPITGSPYQFFFADLDATVAGVDTLYVADDTANQIQKYSLVSGSWTANGTKALTGVRGLTGSVAGSNVTLYVTNNTTIQTLTDTTGYNATIGGTVTSVATAGTNTAFRGIAFTPVTPAAPAPTVTSIVRANANPTNAGTVDYTVTFSEAVTGVGTDDFTLTTTGVTGASVTSVSGTGATYTVTVNTGSGSGTIRLNVTDDDTIVNASATPLGGAGTTNGNFTTGEVYTVDRTAPAVQSIVRANPDPTASTFVDFTVTFTEAVSGVDTSDFAIAAGGSIAGASVTNVSGTGATRTVTVNTGTGSGAVRLDFVDDDSVVDAVGNPTAADFTTGQAYTLDRTPPTVQSVVRAGANPTNTPTVNFTVTFSEPVSGVDTSDFTLTTGGTIAGASVTNVAGTGATRTVTVNTGSGSGTIRLNVVDADTILDPVGNPLAGGYTSGEEYTIDRSAPLVSSIVRSGPNNPTNGTTVEFVVTFTQTVTGVDAADFFVAAGPGISGAGVLNVVDNGTGASYTVTVGTGSGDGPIRLDVHDNDSITNPVTSEPLGGPGANNGDFTTGEVYTVDKTAPTVVSVTRNQPNPTNDPSVSFTVTFSEPVSGVDNDFQLATTGVTGASITSVTGGPTVYTVTVNTGADDGTIRINVADDGTIVDATGNGLPAPFTTGEVYDVDRFAPTVTSVVRAGTSPTAATSVDFTVTFNETVTGVNAADFTLVTTGVSGASITNVTGSGATRTVTVNTGTGTSGTVRLDVVDDDTILDLAGNPLGGGFSPGESYSIQRAPGAPTGLAATPGNNSVGLTWNAVAGATGYNVKRSTTAGSGHTTVATNVGGTTYTDTTATNGTTYYYVVTALNAVGESIASNEVSATPAVPANAIGVVISQVYGGNGGAYQSDYIELYNRTSSAIPLTGYALQYGSSSGQFGSVPSNIYTFGAGVSIGAGKYLTVKFGTAASGAPVTADIDVPTGGLNMSGASGKVALTINGNQLNCGATATPCALPHPSIVDLVSYGAANNGEGGTTVKNGTALTTSEGALRKVGGCQDTQNNNNDFDVATTATGLVPRTAATPPFVCPVPNNPPTIVAPSNPATTVGENAAPFNVVLSGSDDNGQYTWAATPGTGVQSVTVTGGQSTSTATFTVTLQPNFYGTATFTASLSDGVNPSATQPVNIAVTRDLGINHVPTITPPANPAASVPQNAPAFPVTLTGNDDNNIYNWSATPGTGIQSVIVSAGQSTSTVTYTVTVQSGFQGVATFTALLTDGVNPPTSQPVNINVGFQNTHLTISQVYGGGGNNGATYTHDYVEIYNPTGVAVNLTGWSLQYASATTTGNWTQIVPLGGTIPPQKYYLVQLAANNDPDGVALPYPATIYGDVNMSGTNGKVALVRNSDPLTGTCGTLLSDPDIVDFVGYGSANCAEGNAPAPALDSTHALVRDNNGIDDTNHNFNDFTSVTPPMPHQPEPTVEFGPSVTLVEPGVNSTIAPRDLNVVVIFNESVETTGAWYTINCTLSGNHDAATVSRSGSRSWTIVPNVTFTPGEQCTTTLFASQIRDTDTDDSAPGTDFLASNYSWTFTIATGTPPAYPQNVHLTMGNPSGATADQNVPNNYLMEKPELTLSYNLDRGTPNWVSWHLADEWVGTLPRNDTFRADPAIPPTWYRVLGSDYSGSGFDRGHLVPNADRDKETSTPINQATFLMTNMIPQAPDNNQGPWANFENYLRTLLPANELYIVAGGVGTGGTGANGFATEIANGNVTVPAQTWKVVMVLPKAGGDDVTRVTPTTRTIAILMPNTQGIRTTDPNDWMGYITTVDAVEALTGYDFFSAVPDATEAAIEGGTNGTNKPGASNKTATVAEDGSVGITLEGVSPTNAPLTYTIVTPPANGQLSGTGANQTYTPAPNYFGSDSFTYKVNDGQDSNTATVTITVTAVNDAPTAVNDAKSTAANTPLSFPSSDLTANDSRGPANEAAQLLRVTAVTATANTNGNVSMVEGLITYTPNAGFSGPASFTYTVCDDGTTNGAAAPLCANATVNVTVSAQTPTAMVATAGTPQSTQVNTTFATPLQVRVTDASNNPVPNVSVTFTAPASGPSGTFASTATTATVTTNSNGVATAPAFTANAIAGTYVVTATAGSLTANFHLTNTAAPPPAPQATHFLVQAPTTTTPGVPFNVTVTARDASNNVVTGYTGTVHFTSTGSATLPPDYTFTAGDNGTHTFSVTTTTAGMQTITVRDVNNPSITGSTTVNTSCPPGVAPPSQVTMPANVCANSTDNRASVPSGAATYNWTITNGTITSGQGTPTITFTAGPSGTVNVGVTGTHGSGACSGSYAAGGSSNITTAPTASLPPAVAACQGSPTSIPVTLTGNGPWVIRWSDGHVQNASTNRVSRTITVNSPRTLRVNSVSDSTSCTGGPSREVNVLVSTAPRIDVQPEDHKLKPGETARLFVGIVPGAGTIRYQWYQGALGDESKPVGDNFGDYTTPELRETTLYWVKISNSCGSVSSRQVEVRVIAQGRRRPSSSP